MSVQIRRRREAAAFLQTYVGAQGELLVDTTNNRVQVHDGATPGGWPAARLADVAQRTAVADASYQALASDRTIAFTALTAARTVTLPAAAAFPTGTQLLVVDEAGAATSTSTITLARASGDTINGTTGVTITSAFGYVAVESNGVSRWTVVDQAVLASGGGAGATGATGPSGPAGASGPAGPQGTQGGTGSTGATGAAGSSVTIKGSVSTSSALPSSGNALGDGYIANDTGDLWIYSNSSASGSVDGFVNVGLVRGPAGPQGAAGTAGSIGPTGPQGTQGNAGVTGPQGNAGVTGATGPAGFARTQVSDAAYSVATTDRSIAYAALTAARTITLPAASAYPAGAVLTVLDESGACSPALTLTLAAAGSDTINGAAIAVIASAFGHLSLESNTSNKWTIIDAPAPVLSVAGRVGAIALGVADVAGAAPLASPALTGTPTAPNAAAGTNSNQLATTSFVAASFVTYTYAGQTYATASNATLTGTPTAPTQAAKDNSTKLATTAYADAAVAAVTARRQVSDAATTVLAADRTVAYTALTAARTIGLPAASAYPAGAVLTVVDESGACSAALTLTLAAAGSDTINGAATAVVAAAFGYLALESNTANKWTIVDAPAPVLSVAGRAGAVTLGVADIAGAASLASPALTGTPTAPNAAAGTNSSQLATTSFVAASFVTYTYAGQTYATANNATLTGTPTAPTQAAKDNSTKLATTGYTDAAVGAGFARTQVNDAAYNVAATDRTVAYIALSAARTVTLPASSAYPIGATLTIVDESGACSPTNTITLAAAGSDLINGVGAAFLALAYGVLAVESNGAGKWTLVEPLGTLAVQNSGTTNNSSSGAGSFFAHTPTITLPANFLGSGRALRILAAFRLTTGSAPSALSIRLRAGSTPLLLIGSSGAPTASQTSVTCGVTFILQALAAPGGSANVETAPFGNTNIGGSNAVNQVAQPVAVATNAALTLAIDTQWASAGTGTNTITLSQLIVEALN